MAVSPLRNSLRVYVFVRLDVWPWVTSVVHGVVYGCGLWFMVYNRGGRFMLVVFWYR